MDRRVKHMLLAGIVYAAVLGVFRLMHYIDARGIIQIYLPILLVAIAAIAWRKGWFGHALLLGAELGLTLEYLVHLARPGRPSMAGAFLNTVVIVIGLAAGILLQIKLGKRSKTNQK